MAPSEYINSSFSLSQTLKKAREAGGLPRQARLGAQRDEVRSDVKVTKETLCAYEQQSK